MQSGVFLLVEGKTIGEAWEIAPEAVADYLETLPEDHFHCAELAVGALYMALSNYNELQRSPWKKPYQIRSKN
jgi:nitrogen fixation NifU-like protein